MKDVQIHNIRIINKLNYEIYILKLLIIILSINDILSSQIIDDFSEDYSHIRKTI